MRLHRALIPVGAAALAAALLACGGETVVSPDLQESSAGAPRGLSLGPDIAIMVGDIVQFQVVGPSGKPVPIPVTQWASSDPEVADVDADGRVATLKPGQTVITAQVGSLSLARNVTVTAPGGRIVFHSLRPQNSIYSVRPDGTDRIKFEGTWWAGYSDVSPDGQWLVLGDNYVVGVQPVDGSEDFRILFDARPDGAVRGVSWSPVGDQIAFSARPCTGSGCSEPWQLYVADAAGTYVTPIVIQGANPRAPTFPAWSPDGERIAFSTLGAPREVWIVNADGTDPIRVTDEEEPSETHPDWVSDTRLVIARGEVLETMDLYLVDIDGSNLVQLTTDAGGETWPRVSPDGRWVVFWNTPIEHPYTKLSIVRSDGRGRFDVPTETHGQLFPSWGPEP